MAEPEPLRDNAYEAVRDKEGRPASRADAVAKIDMQRNKFSKLHINKNKVQSIVL